MRQFETGSVSEVELTLVVPFFNVGEQIYEHFIQLINVLDSQGMRYEILAVSDGSTDDSVKLIKPLTSEKLSIIELKKNEGKGFALRTGLSMGSGKYLGFIDADGDIPAELLNQFIQLIQAHQPDIIYGNKRHPGSRISFPLLRRIYSVTYQSLLMILFSISIRDTQTGIKFMKREVAEAVLPIMIEKRFAFDLELFVVAKKLGYKDIIDAPVIINERIQSSISFRAVLNIIKDTFAIFYRLKITKYYDQKPNR